MIRKMYTVRPTLTVRLTEDDLEDILSTALDGIGSWCREVIVPGELRGGEVCEQLTHGGTLVFVPCAENLGPRELTLKDLLRGVRLWLESAECSVTVERGRIDTYGELDARDADAIVRYALFGVWNWREG